MSSTTCTLEFLDSFEGPCRLLLDDEMWVEGKVDECIRALDRLIDPYNDPFTMKKADGSVTTRVLRTAAQRAAGLSSIIHKGH